MSLTRGPLPARVYWRRRLLVLGTALLLVFAFARLLGAGSDASSEPEAAQVAARQTPSASATTPAGVLPSDTALPGDAGTATTGTATTGAGAGQHERGARPRGARGPVRGRGHLGQPEAKNPVAGRDVKILLRLRTTESAACTWEVSSRTLTMKITSGNDDIWSTRECPRAVPQQEVVVRRDTTTKLKLTWPEAKRSDDTCSRRTGWALPGYYHVEVAALAGEPTDEQFKLEAPTGPVITRSPSPHQEPSGRPVVPSSSSSVDSIPGRRRHPGRHPALPSTSDAA